ncbi:MAG: tRNA (cytidine(34)-2'-O)-methyltransferase [Oscillospiraceae bacterium]
MDTENILNLVLFQPQIPQNTGNIARTCAATNSILHLVKPLGFEIDDKKLKRAGLDYWNFLDIRYYENTEDFFEKTKNTGEYYFFTTKGLNKYSDINYKNNCYLIFGREDAGIDEEILFAHKSNCVRVPMQGGARSLNLSNTVALSAYEVLRQWDFPQLTSKGKLTKFDWNNVK